MTQPELTTVRGIVRAAGGATAVERRTGMKRSSIYTWENVGIVVDHWPTLIEMAAERGVTITAEMLMRATLDARGEREKSGNGKTRAAG